ncbi:hypothetical protein D915_010054 [Fasciola hepatica]|uniref:Uncharacterized protein n=1 Tax=Fasciola hepatica TaxID=6192 RepID=A0A4E0RD09_FASHE|nr:hypothetical protein D915_010054 [Fasciola hepatica]
MSGSRPLLTDSLTLSVLSVFLKRDHSVHVTKADKNNVSVVLHRSDHESKNFGTFKSDPYGKNL